MHRSPMLAKKTNKVLSVRHVILTPGPASMQYAVKRPLSGEGKASVNSETDPVR